MVFSLLFYIIMYCVCCPYYVWNTIIYRVISYKNIWCLVWTVIINHHVQCLVPTVIIYPHKWCLVPTVLIYHNILCLVLTFMIYHNIMFAIKQGSNNLRQYDCSEAGPTSKWGRISPAVQWCYQNQSNCTIRRRTMLSDVTLKFVTRDTHAGTQTGM